MKIKFLSIFIIFYSLSFQTYSQNSARLIQTNMVHFIKPPDYFKEKNLEKPLLYQPKSCLPLKKKGHEEAFNTNMVNILSLGSSCNAFSIYGNNRTYLWAEPSISTISFSHRSISPTIGNIKFDLSKNGGQSWDVNLGPVYKTTGTPPLDHPQARYPQGAIFNPLGNSIADSAFFTYYAPLRDTTNPGANSSDWGGIGYGVYQLSTLKPPSQHYVYSTQNMKHLIPDAYHISQTGTLYTLEPSYDMINNDYTDSLILGIGIYNQSIHDVNYTFKNIYAPLTNYDVPGGKKVIADSKIAFAPDGLTGYISMPLS